jgi:2-oxo-4-hydroxy-4-carboxy--5-ureidoimidazoline (OHCU) decarboxylase
MKELWTAQVHLLTPPAERGNTRALTNVVAWATDAEDFSTRITSIFERRHWTILNVRRCQRAAECTAMVEELAEQVEHARKQPGGCVFGTLHYYPSRIA